MEETLRALNLPPSQGFVTQIANLIQIRDFHKPLRLTHNFHTANALFTVNLLQVSYSHVEDVALANVNLLIGLHLQSSNKLRCDTRGLLQIRFLAEKLLIKPDVNEIVLELAGFLTVGAYDHAKKQVSASRVINENSQLRKASFSSCITQARIKTVLLESMEKNGACKPFYSGSFSTNARVQIFACSKNSGKTFFSK